MPPRVAINPKWRHCGAALLGLLLSVTACADTAANAAELRQQLEALQPGFVALSKGDANEAFKIWLPLAEQDFAPAQHNIGLLYEKGRGVPQSQVEALQWFWLAELNGYSKSGKPRRELQSKLPAPAVEQLSARLKTRLFNDVLAPGGRKARRYARFLEQAPRAADTLAEDSYVWNAVAAALGEAPATGDRDRLAKDFAPERLVELQALAVAIFEHSADAATLAKDYPKKAEDAEAP